MHKTCTKNGLKFSSFFYSKKEFWKRDLHSYFKEWARFRNMSAVFYIATNLIAIFLFSFLFFISKIIRWGEKRKTKSEKIKVQTKIIFEQKHLIKSRRRRKLRSCLLFADANIETLSLVCSFSPKMPAFLEESCVWSLEKLNRNFSFFFLIFYFKNNPKRNKKKKKIKKKSTNKNNPHHDGSDCFCI